MTAQDEDPIDLARRLGMPGPVGEAEMQGTQGTPGEAAEELARLQHGYEARKRRQLAVTLVVTSVLVVLLIMLAVQVGRAA